MNRDLKEALRSEEYPEMKLIDQYRLESRGSVEINMEDYDVEQSWALPGTVRTDKVVGIIINLGMERTNR